MTSPVCRVVLPWVALGQRTNFAHRDSRTQAQLWMPGLGISSRGEEVELLRKDGKAPMPAQSFALSCRQRP
jgi:hypothetical protein